jgi:DNA-binding CsgD family transcriptional regulator
VGALPPDRLAAQIRDLNGGGLRWVEYVAAVERALLRAIPFTRSCWHSVDPGTVLFTGSLNRNIGCSGSWIAEHEYVIEDVNKWAFLAHSGRLAGATSLATHGQLSRSARHRSHTGFGIGDELRVAFVSDGVYWGSAALLREADQPWFTEQDVATVAWLSAVIAAGARRALLNASIDEVVPAVDGPGVILFDPDGRPESITPAAEHWIGQIVEDPAPPTPSESRIVQAVAVTARHAGAGADPLQLAARSRVRTRTGTWLLLYGSRLNGEPAGRTAVVIQPAPASEIAPLVALAYGLTGREQAVTRLCIEGRSTRQIADRLTLSAYTVQDHLKSIFAKTGVRSRGELVGQIFLEHRVPRWESVTNAPPGWDAYAEP